MDTKEIAMLSMEQEAERAERVTDEASSRRKKALDVLDRALDKIEFSEEDIRDPKSSSAMLSIISQYASVSKMDEDAAFKRVTAKARMKEVKSNEQQSETTVALIKSLCERNIDSEIENDISIEETELNLSPDLSESIKDTELRDDPDDLT